MHSVGVVWYARVQINRDVLWCSTKPHPLESLKPLEKLRLREWAFRRMMSLYKTQFQGLVMAATGEQSCLKLTLVSLAIDPRTVRLQRSDLC